MTKEMLSAEQLGLRNYQLTHKDTRATYVIQAKSASNAFARFVAKYFRSSHLKPGRGEYSIRLFKG